MRRAAAAPAPRFARAVFQVVREIPRGRVATYGQVAAVLGHPRAARAVGGALSRLPAALQRLVPWQRVINAAGRISIRGDLHRPDLQRQLLELEGVRFRRDQIDLRQFRWAGPGREKWVRTGVEWPYETQARGLRSSGRRGLGREGKRQEAKSKRQK